MKTHILHNLRDQPWGGGNQFLKALRDEWKRQGVYSETPEQADVIHINSYPFGAEHLFGALWHLKRRHPEKVVVYRMDGPISIIRQKDHDIDRIIRTWNNAIADGIVFQSCWCEEQNLQKFGTVCEYQTVIHNAPDPTIFYPSHQKRTQQDQIKLVATSWSANPRKGFDVYTYLDAHLNFDRYNMTFIGNAPKRFKNIKMLDPLPSRELADVLRAHDLFITASKTDPCSNSLIEALACGLPAVALNDGGHPELVQRGGELFDGEQDVLKKIDQVAGLLSEYKQHLPTFTLRKTADAYLQFAQRIWDDATAGRYSPKQVSVDDLLAIKRKIATWKIKHVWNRLIGSSN